MARSSQSDGGDAKSVPKKKGVRRKAKVAPSDLLEQRLAAFGETFLDSIEGGAPKRRKPPPPSAHSSGRAEVAASAAASGPAEAAAAAADASDDGGVDGPRAEPSEPVKKRRRGRRRRAAAAASADGPPKVAEAPMAPAAPAGATDAVAAAATAPQRPGPNGAGAGPGVAPGAGRGGVGSRPAPAKPAQLPSAAPRMTAAQRRRFMSGNVSEIRAKPMKPPTSRRRRGGDGADEEDSDSAEFKKTLKEVLDFVIPNLGRKEQRQYEEQKVRALGGTIEKREKMPYALLQKLAKKNEAKRQEKLAEEKTLGISTSASAHRQAFMVDKLLKQKKEAAKDKKRRREDRTYDLGMGAREKNGMAVIPQRSIQRFQQRGKK